MKILNLYAGIGGNRQLWEDVEVTAVEYDKNIAAIYKDLYPNDEVIVGDAQEYLRLNFEKFDFIWASPPCPSHSRVRKITYKHNKVEPLYPSMSLYEVILFLQHYYKGKFVVENVIPYYKPLIEPTVKLQRHFFWSNFEIKDKEIEKRHTHTSIEANSCVYGINLKNYKVKNKRQILRNMVNPALGKHILECVRGGNLEIISLYLYLSLKCRA